MQAVIWVERTGQKAIVIGKGGELLKEVGRLARLDLKQHFGQPVHLELWVKVKEDWSDERSGAQQLRVRQVSAGRRMQLEPGFLLHHYPWRDSSRILELLTRVMAGCGCSPARRAVAEAACRLHCSRSQSYW